MSLVRAVHAAMSFITTPFVESELEVESVLDTALLLGQPSPFSDRVNHDLLFGDEETLCGERESVMSDMALLGYTVTSEETQVSLEQKEAEYFASGEHLRLQSGSMFSEVKKFVMHKYVDLIADPKEFISTVDDAIHDTFNYIEGVCCAIELLRRAVTPEDVGLAITISYKLVTGRSLMSTMFDYMEWLMLLIAKIADSSVDMHDIAPEKLFRHTPFGGIISRTMRPLLLQSGALDSFEWIIQGVRSLIDGGKDLVSCAATRKLQTLFC